MADRSSLQVVVDDDDGRRRQTGPGGWVSGVVTLKKKILVSGTEGFVMQRPGCRGECLHDEYCRRPGIGRSGGQVRDPRIPLACSVHRERVPLTFRAVTGPRSPRRSDVTVVGNISSSAECPMDPRVSPESGGGDVIGFSVTSVPAAVVGEIPGNGMPSGAIRPRPAASSVRCVFRRRSDSCLLIAAVHLPRPACGHLWLVLNTTLYMAPSGSWR